MMTADDVRAEKTPEAVLSGCGCVPVPADVALRYRRDGYWRGERLGATSTGGVARFKWPERTEVVDALPVTNVGTVDKKQLRDDIAAKVRRGA